MIVVVPTATPGGGGVTGGLLRTPVANGVYEKLSLVKNKKDFIITITVTPRV